MITAADALRFCMAQPGAVASDCRQAVADQMVGGVYCDGDVIMSAGAPPRCVPSDVIARKLAAQQKSGIVGAAAPNSTTTNVAAVVAIVVVVGIVAFWSGRD